MGVVTVGEVRVDFGALGSGAAGIMSTYRSLQGTLENLESQLAPMVSTWNGQAQEAYLMQKRKWDDASAAMAAILQRMGQGVQQAHENYQSAETSNRGLWA
jgi:early secretory antigenic target protein ESAT-6